MAAMTSSNSNFQNPRKTYKVYILEIIRAKFHQNRFSRLGCSADTDRQTDTRTHTHTHIHTPSVRSQHIQSKWLNIKREERLSSRTWLALLLPCEKKRNMKNKIVTVEIKHMIYHMILLQIYFSICQIWKDSNS